MAYVFSRSGASALLAWYKTNARDLPWRRDPTAYRVLVSETMLQQTRIAVVEKRFDAFVERFPDISALAAAQEDEVLKAWQGLGYYSRARSLLACARAVRERYGGILPASYGLLRALPGVGDYTASAVAAIAYGLPCPVADGNAVRVLSRFCADESDAARPAARREARLALEDALPREDSGGFAQALMELGETLCLPNAAPLCGGCPLRGECRGYLEGDPSRYPVRKARPPRRHEDVRALVYVSEGRLLLVKRPKGGLLAGTFGLPLLPEGEPLPDGASLFARHRHAFTHVEWDMRAYLLRSLPALPEGAVFAGAREISARCAVASAFLPIVEKALELPDMKA